jgi:hypothetical protein
MHFMGEPNRREGESDVICSDCGETFVVEADWHKPSGERPLKAPEPEAGRVANESGSKEEEQS